MKFIVLITLFAFGAAKPTTTTTTTIDFNNIVTIDLDKILTESRNTPIGLPENGERLFCRNWILTGPDRKIVSNGADKPLYTNTEYGFSSLWSKVPVKNPTVSIGDIHFTIDEFINMMSWNKVIVYNDEIATSFTYLPYELKFSNCDAYDNIVNRIKSRVSNKMTPIQYNPFEKKLVDAVDTTGCFDDSTCVKRLCFPVDPTNVYNYDESQVILYNTQTRMCYRYTGNISDRDSDSVTGWYQITDDGGWD